MATKFEPDFLHSPAVILDFKVLREISCLLCTQGALVNWKHVACELGYSTSEITGEFSNYNGCLPAERVLLDFIHRKGGRIQELVDVFTNLELAACLQELEASQKSVNGTNCENDSTNNAIEPTAVDYGISGDENLEHKNEMKNQELDILREEKDLDEEIKPDTTILAASEQNVAGGSLKKQVCSETENGAVMSNQQGIAPSNKEHTVCQHEVLNNQSVDNGFPTIVDFPERPCFNRSKSVPHKSPFKGFKNIFKRSRSVDSSKLPSCNENPVMKKRHSKSFSFWKKNHRDNKQLKGSSVRKEKEVLKIDISPDSDGSPSMPSQMAKPSSTTSIESGYKAEDHVFPQLPPKSSTIYENSKKKIYIICARDDPKIFEEALKLFWQFQVEKGYQCHMSCIDYQDFCCNPNRYVYQQILTADNVFLCVSEKLKETFEANMDGMKSFDDDDGQTLRFSSDLIMGDVASKGCNEKGKFMTILLSDDSDQHIPLLMRNYCKYKWPLQERKMENTIHGRADVEMPPVNNTRKAPSQKVSTANGIKSVIASR
ncbi:uncharacterized protein LOC116619733 [Nematostella vectensis]|uniref:uncharacterized protein LOC116619733 n=1 Tax=Nematostella vectensis TaxID=45351 RepID=UPI0020774E8C|nr:uncharacterized protein LOC116619733 [Nematostella vectensis]